MKFSWKIDKQQILLIILGILLIVAGLFCYPKDNTEKAMSTNKSYLLVTESEEDTQAPVLCENNI